ncbi:unnamed protein product [Paramecium octaurelia]|uniref:Uncharacterized protein n=1 Tax=Paramecium octaurelia TaxID=43137 RepID=A0A8S1XRD1_PAROT|nr:unnamed protein product [Paramecium octaurelia]
MKKIQKQTIKLRNQQQSLQNQYEDHISSREHQLSQNNLSNVDAIPQAQQDQQNIEQQIDQNRIRRCKSRSWHKRLDCRVNHSEMKEGRFSKQEVDCIMKVVNEYLLSTLSQSRLDSLRYGSLLQNKYPIEVLIQFIS